MCNTMGSQVGVAQLAELSLCDDGLIPSRVFSRPVISESCRKLVIPFIYHKKDIHQMKFTNFYIICSI
jgi:hypothetical protein